MLRLIEPNPHPETCMSAYRSGTTPARISRTLGTCIVVACLLTACRDAESSHESRPAGFGYRPLARPTTNLGLGPAETLPELLARGGLSGPDARRVMDIARPYTDRTRPDPGLEARFHRWPGEPPERIDLRVDPDVTLTLDLVGAVWQVTVDSLPATIDTLVVTGAIETNLWSARLGGDSDAMSVGEKADLTGRLADVFAWQIDFYRDPRPGDAYRLALERAVRPDGSVRSTTVLAAEYARGSDVLHAFRFTPDGGGAPLYFDQYGSALKGAFLKAPLDLVRVTSRFSSARFHPVRRTYRSHAGVDYGAPSGTPVRATGDGRVLRAGWVGDLGLMVELDHGRGLRTRYAHLSGIADDVAVGRMVQQRDVIGAVGSTGLSTASHLHYEFRQHGRAVDPASVDLPVERPIAPADAARFEEASGAARSILGRAFWPTPLPGTLSASGTSEPAR